MRSSINLPPVVFFLVAIVGCALPSAEYENQVFIPRREVLAASLFQEATTLYNSGRYVDAELKFREVDYLYPNTDNTKVNLALALRGTGAYDEAIKILQDVIKRNPNAIDYQFFLAETYYRAAIYSKAITAYDELITKLPPTEKSRIQTAARTLATILFEIGREGEALCYSQLAFSLASTPPDLVRHMRLKIAYGDSKGSAKDLQDYFVAQPTLEDPLLWKQKSLASIGVGDLKEAATYFDLAASKSANNPDSELAAIGSFLEVNGESGALAKGLLGASGGQLKPEEDEIAQAEIDILSSYSPFVYLYWPPNLVEHVSKKVSAANVE